MKLYFSPVSGHSHRVQLMLGLLQVEHELIEVDLHRGEQTSPAFLRLNPWGEVPVLVDGDVVLRDSTAIVVYLARRYAPTDSWMPSEPLHGALVQQWLSIASGELLRGPVLARAALVLRKPYDLEAAQHTGGLLLRRMNAHLTGRRWLVGTHPTVADVVMYSYVAVADEGGLQLDAHPAIGQWLESVQRLPGFIPMPRQG